MRNGRGPHNQLGTPRQELSRIETHIRHPELPHQVISVSGREPWDVYVNQRLDIALLQKQDRAVDLVDIAGMLLARVNHERYVWVLEHHLATEERVRAFRWLVLKNAPEVLARPREVMF